VALVSTTFHIHTVPRGVLPGDRPPPPRLTMRTILVAPVSPRTWAATMHVLLDMVIGTITFTFAVTAVSLVGSLVCTLVLWVPALAIMVVGLRAMGWFERARFNALLQVPIDDPHPIVEGTLWEKTRAWVFGAALWKELAYALLLFPLGTIGFSLVSAVWSASIAMILLPTYVRLLPDQTAHLWLFDISQGPGVWLMVGVGVALAFLAPWVARGWATIDIMIGRTLLGRNTTEELTERVESLEVTRTWAVEIAEAERRRIERDLHDGAQQRLVALAMDLGLAQAKLDDDPERARELIDHAHGEAKRAIIELRDLARGIHPVSLSDRGLAGAIPALAGRSTIPVRVDVRVPDRLPASIEGIAYFVVSECLANATKHSSARNVWVVVVHRDDTLLVEVTDDGVGAADLELGTGLRGLSDRVASVDGTFDVSSPLGGPTTIRVELPCAS